MASLLHLTLLSLLYNIPGSQGAPTRRQFRPGGYGQPDYQVGPPWFGGPRFGPPGAQGPGFFSSDSPPQSPAAVVVPTQPPEPTVADISPTTTPASVPDALPTPLSSVVSATSLPTTSIPPSIAVLTSTNPLTTDTDTSPAQFLPSVQGTVATEAPPDPSSTIVQVDPLISTQAPIIESSTTALDNTQSVSTASTVQSLDPTLRVPTPSTPSSSPSIGDNPTLLNGTLPGNVPPSSPPSATPGLSVELVNNFDEASINVYVTAKDEAGRVMLLLPDLTWFYPTANSDAIPEPITNDVAIPLGAIGATKALNLPGFFQSGRIYFSTLPLQFSTLLNPTGGVTLVAPDPFNPADPASSSLWSFVEMTYSSVSGLFANLSFVDFLGLPVGMSLSAASGGTFAEGAASSTQTVEGTSPASLEAACAALAAKAAEEGVPEWGKLCEYATAGTSPGSQILRVDAPGKYIAARDSSAFRTYWDAYVQQVWAKYASEPLYVDTQNGLGTVSCSTASGYLACTGASRPLPAPLSSISPTSALDIFSCSGIFSTQATDNAVDLAVLPRICAALNRSTLLLSGGNTQPGPAEELYYTAAAPGTATNWYAKVAHDVESDGRGYAFAYDDVNPTGAKDASGTVTAGVGSIGVWKIVVGGLAGE